MDSEEEKIYLCCTALWRGNIGHSEKKAFVNNNPIQNYIGRHESQNESPSSEKEEVAQNEISDNPSVRNFVPWTTGNEMQRRSQWRCRLYLWAQDILLPEI